MKVKIAPIERLKALKGFERLGEKEAQIILSSLKNFAICLFKIYKSKKNREKKCIIENQQVMAQNLQKIGLKPFNQLTHFKHAA